jgi:lipopolysaccharide export system permease protein
MKLTDKYILGKFLYILGFSLLAFILVVLIVDIVENVDKFIDNKAPVGLIINYYILYLPFIIVLVLPVAVLLATMFTIGGLARYQELTIMKASGLSLYRLAAPLLACGFIISLLMIVFSDIIMVPAEAKRDRLKKTQIEHRADTEGMLLTNVIKPGQDGWVIYARTYNEKTKTVDYALIQKIANNQMEISIRANSMVWADSGWILRGMAKRIFEGEKEISFVKRDSVFVQFLSQTPEIMSHKVKKPRDTRFFELLELIKLKKLMGQDIARDLVELYLKFSFPFINFIIIIIGIPLSANPRRSGGSVGLGLSVIISFLYFVILRAGQSFGYTKELPPLLSVWIGNIVFFVIGAIMFIRARK